MVSNGGDVACKFVHGIATVHEDGSALFTVPANKNIYFQALDEHGMAVQSMRSGTYVHPGEHLSCQGCHEPKRRPPPRIETNVFHSLQCATVRSG